MEVPEEPNYFYYCGGKVNLLPWHHASTGEICVVTAFYTCIQEVPNLNFSEVIGYYLDSSFP
jgi:hypothetical protein